MSTKPDTKPQTGDKPKPQQPKEKKPDAPKAEPKKDTTPADAGKPAKEPQTQPKGDKNVEKTQPQADKAQTQPQDKKDAPKEKKQDKPSDHQAKPQDGQPREPRKDGEGRRDVKTQQTPREPRKEGDREHREPRKEGDREHREPRKEGDREPRKEGDREPREPRKEGDREPRKQGDREHREPRKEGDREPREPRKEGDRELRKDGDRKDRTDGGEYKGERRDRRPRTEGGEPRERKEGDRDREPREPRPPREKKKRDFDREWRSKIVVTVDTEIPVLPKELLQKPKIETLTAALDECDRKVGDYEKQIKVLQDKRVKWRDTEKSKRNAERAVLTEERDTKSKAFGEMTDLNKLMKPHDEKKKAIELKMESIQDRLAEIEKGFQGKSVLTAEQVKDAISALQDRQQNGKINGTEEKKILQDLAVYTKLLPIAEEYSKVSAERNPLRDERKKIMEEWGPLFEKKKALKKVLEAYKKDEEAEKKAGGDKKTDDKKTGDKKTDDKKTGDQKTDDRKGGDRKGGDKTTEGDDKEERVKKVWPEDPFSKEIETTIEYKKQMFKKKNDLRDKYEKDWDLYYDQQQKVREAEYIVKQKDYLKKIEETKLRKAKERRAQLIQEYLTQNTPKEDATLEYRDELSATELLSSYLTSILPSNKKLFVVESVDEAVLNPEDLQKSVAGLKGLQLQVNKKEPITYGPTKKKDNKKKDKDAKEEKKNVVEEQTVDDSQDPNKVLVFDLQIRNAFSQLKLDPPTANKDLNATLDILEKKKAELDQLVKEKTSEFTNLRSQAEANVPTIDELKELFKDPPIRERDEDKGTHGHKERRGTRGGRGGSGGSRGGRGRGGDGTSDVQWRGGRPDRHPRREGEQERVDLEVQEEAADEDSFEEEKRRREKERRGPQKKSNLAETDFPKL